MHNSPSRRTEQIGPRAEPSAESCPDCSLPRNDRDRFCERCGFDYAAPGATATAAQWVAEITVDRDYYDRVAPENVPFPTDRPPAVVALGAGEVLIGRRGPAGPAPAIDLSGPLADPGVSRHHATITRGADGVYRLRDAGSTNGTTINDDQQPIGPAAPTELADGDRIHVGAWTTITVRRP